MERLIELRTQAAQIADKMSRPNINYSYLEMLREAKVKIAKEIRDLEIKLGFTQPKYLN